MPSHAWGDFAGLAQAVIHDAEIQVNPLLPGAMPQFPEGPRRDQRKYWDRYLSLLGAWQQQLACLHAMQMALHQGREATALLLAEQTQLLWEGSQQRNSQQGVGSGPGQETSSTEATCRGRKWWQGSAQVSQAGQITHGREPGGSGWEHIRLFFSPHLWSISNVESYPGLQRVKLHWEQSTSLWGEEKNDGTEERKERRQDLKWASPRAAGLGSTTYSWRTSTNSGPQHLGFLVCRRQKSSGRSGFLGRINVSSSMLSMTWREKSVWDESPAPPVPQTPKQQPTGGRDLETVGTHKQATCLSRAVWFGEDIYTALMM